jgi:hypothetical protein
MRSSLPNSVPDHSLVWVSRWRQVMSLFCSLSKPSSEPIALHLVVEALDQPVADREAGQQRQETLGDAEGHVGAVGVAPFGQDLAAAIDDA